MSFQYSTLARPYAQAVFNFACERNTLEKWELMLICAKNITQNPIMMKLLSIVDYIRSEELSEMFILIAQNTLDYYGQNFIRILAEHKRLCLIPTIFEEFFRLFQKRKMIVEIKIVTSLSLTKSEMFKIMTIMKKKFPHEKINITYELDQSIIGGIICHVNNFVIDSSIQGCINRLKYALEI